MLIFGQYSDGIACALQTLQRGQDKYFGSELLAHPAENIESILCAAQMVRVSNKHLADLLIHDSRHQNVQYLTIRNGSFAICYCLQHDLCVRQIRLQRLFGLRQGLF